MENVKDLDHITAEDETPVVKPLIDIEEPKNDEPSESMVGVVNATRLNIRNAPNMAAKVIAVVPVFTELLIDPEQIDDEWYSVCTASGIEGFCMKEFVVIQQ